MAAVMVRLKWLMMRKFRFELFPALLVFVLITCFLVLLWELGQPPDGTFIDLSERHQMELIEKYKKERQLMSALKQRQEDINKLEGLHGIDDEMFFQGHAGILRDARFEESQFNLSKHLQEHPHLITLSKKQAGYRIVGGKFNKTGQKKEEKYIKYYDPNQGKIIYKPVIMEDTELKGGIGYCKVYDLSTTLTEDYDCMLLNVTPATPICLYPDEMDVHISKHIRSEGTWEPHILHYFQRILSLDPDLAVVDVGANIGQYALVAAAMGHNVIAVEPYVNNIKHLQKAAQLSNLTNRIIVLHNAISDKRRESFLKLEADNQGGCSLEIENPNPDGKKPPSVNSILMDDLLEVITFKKALVKIDIEGHEHRAFLHSSEFFKKVSVPYIFMEWMKLRQYYGSEITNTEDKSLTTKLIKYLLNLGYDAYSSVTMEKLNPDWWVSWTDDIIWKYSQNY